jgi:multidrug transporter EmrE-like cation transporter
MGPSREFFKEKAMNALKIVGIVLIIAGAAALAYGGFSFTKETHRAEIGPLKLSVQEKQDVNIPSWLGIAAIVAGVAMLVVPTKK